MVLISDSLLFSHTPAHTVKQWIKDGLVHRMVYLFMMQLLLELVLPTNY